MTGQHVRRLAQVFVELADTLVDDFDGGLDLQHAVTALRDYARSRNLWQSWRRP